MTILGKKQMSEEDIKLNYITPVILKGWKGHITMETKITDGRINIRGNIVARSKPKFADYMLYLNDGKPIAVVEAKDNNHSVSHGLQQAMTYAQMMDLPFAYSSNGDAFYEHDFLTGQEQQIDLDKFPTQDELVARYYAELNGGKGISDTEKKIVSQPYYSSQSTYPPRYYQRNAVNRTVEAIARGQQRLLLVMATGTGKTYTAFQIVYRLLRSDLKKRILYLADRNILVDQSILQDFAPLEKTIYKVDFSDKECLSKIASHEVNFALYHQMVGQNDEEHFKQIPAEYFDLIIVDECHRGSAKEDSNWRKVLEYFSSARDLPGYRIRHADRSSRGSCRRFGFEMGYLVCAPADDRSFLLKPCRSSIPDFAAPRSEPPHFSWLPQIPDRDSHHRGFATQTYSKPARNAFRASLCWLCQVLWMSVPHTAFPDRADRRFEVLRSWSVFPRADAARRLLPPDEPVLPDVLPARAFPALQPAVQ